MKNIITLSLFFAISIFSFDNVIFAQATQIPLPGQITTYNGNVRGFWFTAPIDMKITGLRIPSGAGAGSQNIEFFIFPTPPPPFPGTITNYTSAIYIQGAPNGVIQNVDIDVSAGEHVGVLGQAGTLTSYGPTGQYTTTIDGNAVTLTRLLYQGSISTGPAGAISEELGGNLGLIEVYWEFPITAPNDVGIVSIDSPTVFCPGLFDIYATIRNFGINQIDSAIINWSIDGVLQTPVNYVGFLDTTGGTGSNTASVLLGTNNFATNNPYTISAWTSMPNGVLDTITQNDTIVEIIQSNLPPPANITASALFSTQATINWTGGSANSWLYQNLPAGTTPTGIGTALSNATVTLTGLTQNTMYDFYVREVCPSGDTSAWALYSYTTPCALYV
ncbi:MAG: hypothetical protein RLO12_20390, partial [Fulvivirga sp.]